MNRDNYPSEADIGIDVDRRLAEAPRCPICGKELLDNPVFGLLCVLHGPVAELGVKDANAKA